MTGVEAAVLTALADDPLRAVLLVVVGALLEGPVVTVTAAALAGAGVLSWWGVWLAAASADVIADTLLYLLGRHGDRGRPRRMLARLGLTDERRDALTVQVHSHLPGSSSPPSSSTSARCRHSSRQGLPAWASGASSHGWSPLRRCGRASWSASDSSPASGSPRT